MRNPPVTPPFRSPFLSCAFHRPERLRSAPEWAREHGARGGVPMRRLHLPSSKPGRQPLGVPCSDHWHLTTRAATGSTRSTGKHPPCAGWPAANAHCQGPLHPRPPVPLSAPLSSLPLSPPPRRPPFPCLPLLSVLSSSFPRGRCIRSPDAHPLGDRPLYAGKCRQ